MGWKKTQGRKFMWRGRPPKYKTWLALWMDARQLTMKKFGRMMFMAKDANLSRWRSGKYNISQRSCRMMRALYPDCPVSLRGGRPALLSEMLPINARSTVLYRFLFLQLGLIGSIENAAAIWPAALEAARMIERPLQPSEGAIATSKPHP